MALLVGAYYAIQQENLQNWLTQKVTKELSKKLGTDVEVKHIKIDFLNHLNLQGVYIADQKKDTLLYAGELQFKITDWFFLKKTKPVISYIGLSDAIVNLNRTRKDSVWNYEFIAKAFAPSTIDTTKKTPIKNNTNDTSIAFDIQTVALNNIKFNSIDKWVGENIIANVNEMNLNANKIDWKQKWIDLASIKFNKTYFTYEDYEGGRGKRKKIDTIDTTPFNPLHWRITLNSFELKNSGFVYNQDFEKPKANLFDEQHLNITNINLNFENVKVIDDTLTSIIHQLQAKDRCGFEIKNLQANVKLTPLSTKLEQLNLITNNSKIGDSYEMIYNRFPDFNDYITKVIMKANFKNANISFDDIAYFAPQIKNVPIKNAIINKGDFTGTVANLVAKDVNISVGKSSLLGNLSMRGLPDINKTFIELESKNLQTSGNELIKFIPSANTNNVAWASLSFINFKGKYKGYISDFITDGTLTTNLGTVFTNIHFTFLPNKQPTYNGYFNTNNLQLGKIVKQTVVGNISASGNVVGSGFDVDHLNTSFNGDVKSIATNGYTYQNIKINGNFSNKKFDGKINSNDPNIAMNFDGQFDFSKPNPDFNLKTKLVKFDLQKLGLTTQAINGSADMDLDFKGKTIDDFTGSAKFYNLKLNDGNKKIDLDSAIITSTPIGVNKTITLRSSAIDANLTGNFTILNLPIAMQYFLSNYLPNYIKKPKNVLPQQFVLHAVTKNADPIFKTFFPAITSSNNIKVDGSLDMFKQALTLNVIAPNFKYENYLMQNINLSSNGNYNDLNITGSTDKIFIADQEIIPNATFNTTLGHDTAVVLINTAGGAYNVKNATIQAKGFASNDKLFLNILPSNFYFNQTKWDLNTDDYLLFENVRETIDGKTKTRNKITIGDITLESGLQKIKLHSDGTQQENIIANVQNIEIAELTKFAQKPADDNSLDFRGRINGTVIVNNYATKPAISGNINTTDIYYKGDTLGSLIADASFDQDKKLITINNTSGLIYKNDKTGFNGTVDLTSAEPLLNLHALLNNTNLKTFEKFFEKYIANTQGVADGFIDIVGPVSSYKLNGQIDIKNLKTKILYIGTTYTIPKGHITLNETDINLGSITIYDELKNDANLKGHIYHNHFKNICFGRVDGLGERNQLRIYSTKFQFLNTSEKDNSLYYGNVIAKGSMNIEGPLENLVMEITTTTLKNTKLTLPIRGNYDGSQYDFIKFKDYKIAEDTTKNKETNAHENNRLKIDLTIIATPEAEMKILMDPVTGEEIIGKGNGRIKMDIDLDNEMKMNGTYNIEEGLYGYTFKNIIKKDLKIVPGGTVTWDGKPLEAKLNIEASYSTKTNLYPLLGNDISSATAADRIDYPTDVIIKLSGPMLAPNINFDISQPNNNNFTSLGYNKLKELKANDQKLLFQAASLIVTNQFTNTEASSGNNNTTTTALLNTINGVVSSTLSNMLSQSISKMIGAKNLQIILDYKNSSSTLNNAGSVDQFNYTVKKSYYNERVTFEIGDNFDYQRTLNKSTYNAMPNDFKFKYFIHPDGNLSVTLFRTMFTDIASSSSASTDQKIGIGLNYRKSFNHFKEIWNKSAINTNILTPDIDTLKGTW